MPPKLKSQDSVREVFAFATIIVPQNHCPCQVFVPTSRQVEIYVTKYNLWIVSSSVSEKMYICFTFGITPFARLLSHVRLTHSVIFSLKSSVRKNLRRKEEVVFQTPYCLPPLRLHSVPPIKGVIIGCRISLPPII